MLYVFPCVFVFSSPFSIAITSLGEERANLSAFRTFVRFVLVYVCVEVLRPSQPNGVMSSAVSLPNHTFTGQA